MVLIDALEDSGDLIGHEVWVGTGQHVQPNGDGGIGRVDQTRPVPGRLGKALEDRLDQVALRIDHDRGPAGLGVLQGELGE
jgi:hypothetical protein